MSGSTLSYELLDGQPPPLPAAASIGQLEAA
jgi:hypothetical protein